jgi:hypothetical protein
MSEFDPNKNLLVNGKLEYLVQYRNIKWLPAHPLRRDLTAPLAKQLENRRTIIELNKNYYGIEICARRRESRPLERRRNAAAGGVKPGQW